ncbi:phosphotransferase family protein [Aliiglaciecola sp. 3_MG-2023]|uniref:phosphotransferase family protein n=1 Tax=Aliiglaciecola sp. 3_MG-2023 TaxID=3062644 RepID=UPI0026E3FC74|nr:phosphotransferase family protein [Aliiglaciecola sp. 3_MG-2023]MDO6693807.1 phosphotransferase family protein [Aliiglaciecola sp. 3_MG-2023]
MESLEAYFRANVFDFTGEFKAEKFSGGQSNPTFKIMAGDQSYVLRRQPPGKLLKSAHAVDREFKVINALQNTKVPVAKVYHLCEDTSVIGSMFYVMEYVDGAVYWNSSLPEIDSNQKRHEMYQQMSQVLADLHAVDVDKVGLSDYGKAGNYFERQLSRWSKQYKLSEIDPIPEMDTLITWLNQHIPDDDGKVALVHGDYRLDNLMFSKTSTEIIAVLDWELSTLGHPLADLAYQCMQLRLPANIGHSSGLGGVDRQALGIPNEQEFVGWYCQRAGLAKIENWHFYLAFSFFRLAAIAQGVAKRAQEGNASSAQASKVGAMVPPLARMAIELIEEHQ